MERKPKVIKSDIMSRVMKLYAAAIIMGVVIAVRLVYIQFFSPEISRNADKLDQRIYRPVTLNAHRGTIRSRTGEPLAASIFRSKIEFDFGAEGFDDEAQFKTDADSLSKLLAQHFGDRSAREYYNTMVSERAKRNIATTTTKTVPKVKGRVKRAWHTLLGNQVDEQVPHVEHQRKHGGIRLFPNIDYNEWQEMRKWPILNYKALIYTRDEHPERVYPCGPIARSVVGRINDNGTLNGLELVFDPELRGSDGSEWRQHIAYNVWTRVDKPAWARRDTTALGKVENRDAVDGTDVVTTIDIDIQEFADRTLREQVSRHGAIWGTTIVMDVETGDLLAVANITNDHGRLVESFNHAFRSRTEPGSTFKLASMLALLDDAGVPIEKTYDANHGKQVLIQTGTKHPVRVRDSADDGGVIDMKEALAASSNTYFAQAVYEAYRDNPDRYTDFLRKLHLDRKVCVSMPASFGEAEPNFLHSGKSNWTKHESLIKIAFGQGGMEVTPLQIATLYNAVANNGRMVAPRLVLELRRDGRTVKSFPVEVLENKICSSATLAKVRDALEEAALTGTGKDLFGEGKVPFHAAIKTGTAEYSGKGIRYSDGYFVGSMATIFPAENPRYTIMTSIHTRGALHSGARLSGPVNQKIAKFIYARDFDNGRVSDNYDDEHTPTAIKGGSMAQIRKVSDKLSADVKGAGGRGWGRVTVDAETGAMTAAAVSDDDLALMPDVTGMGLKDALFLLEERGLRVSFTGSGSVRSQSIRAGTRIQRGAAVTIVLK